LQQLKLFPVPENCKRPAVHTLMIVDGGFSVSAQKFWKKKGLVFKDGCFLTC
jgi:hypothetical protein